MGWPISLTLAAVTAGAVVLLVALLLSPRVGRALAIAGGVASLVVGAGIVLYAYGKSEFSECFGIFRSSEAAERAADAARAAGFDADVDWRARETAVTFESGETGDDAREFRRTFRRVMRRERGELGHPGGACLERSPFEH